MYDTVWQDLPCHVHVQGLHKRCPGKIAAQDLFEMSLGKISLRAFLASFQRNVSVQSFFCETSSQALWEGSLGKIYVKDPLGALCSSTQLLYVQRNLWTNLCNFLPKFPITGLLARFMFEMPRFVMFCASLRNQNAHGQVTRGILRRNVLDHTGPPFCASLRNQNANGHVPKVVLFTVKLPPTFYTTTNAHRTLTLAIQTFQCDHSVKGKNPCSSCSFFCDKIRNVARNLRF